jgi:urease accessory protein
MTVPRSPSRPGALCASGVLLAALALIPAGALAHAGEFGEHATQTHGFIDGFVHPFTGFDHLGATLAAGLWGARSERRMWAAPLVFVIGLVLGALASVSGLVVPDVEPMIAFSLLSLGLLLASRTYVPPALATSMVCGFAIYHGVAHGVELGSEIALAGLLCATVLLCACGSAIGLVVRSHSPWWMRGAGVALALFGATRLTVW